MKERSLAARYPKVQLMVARIEINRWVELQMNIMKRFFNFKLMLSPYEAAQESGALGVGKRDMDSSGILSFLLSVNKQAD